MVSNPSRGGFVGRIVRGFVFGWRDVFAMGVETVVVPPMDPGQGRELEVANTVPSGGVRPVDALGFVEAVDVFGQGVVVGISHRADARSCPEFIQAFGEPKRRELAPGIGMGDQPFKALPTS